MRGLSPLNLHVVLKVQLATRLHNLNSRESHQQQIKIPVQVAYRGLKSNDCSPCMCYPPGPPQPMAAASSQAAPTPSHHPPRRIRAPILHQTPPPSSRPSLSTPAWPADSTFRSPLERTASRIGPFWEPLKDSRASRRTLRRN
jgi:hypothetical protein